MSTGNSRTADKFVVRLPDGMRDRVNQQAESAYASMNSWIIQAIEEKLERAVRQELLLGALERSKQEQDRLLNALVMTKKIRV